MSTREVEILLHILNKQVLSQNSMQSGTVTPGPPPHTQNNGKNRTGITFDRLPFKRRREAVPEESKRVGKIVIQKHKIQIFHCSMEE